MSEALEKWPQDLIQQLLPRIWEIMCEINRRWCEYLSAHFGSGEALGRNLIIRDGQVHMANLCLATCQKVNGVSRLHGDILKNDLFHDLYTLTPERFTYVTNGIDHRRWLSQINPGLDALVKELTGGDEYLTNPEVLIKLADYANDAAVRERVLAIKRANKESFAEFARRNPRPPRVVRMRTACSRRGTWRCRESGATRTWRGRGVSAVGGGER